MKKILMALTVMSMFHFSAEAKGKKVAKQNYPVCKANSGYKICGEKASTANATKGTMVPVTQKDNSNVVRDEYVTVGSNTPSGINRTYSFEGYMRRHNIVVNDEMRNPYEGEPSRQYDGPKRNEYRNLNSNNSSVSLPPSDGNMSK